MLRFAAFIWDPSNPRASETARALISASRLRFAWRWALSSQGLAVGYIDERRKPSGPYVLEGNQGLVLGTLFRRKNDSADAYPQADHALGAGETEGIVTSGGRQLVQEYWGSYVGIIRGAMSRKTCVVAAPMGNLPCITREFAGVVLCFSRMEDCADLPLLKYSIDWEAVSSYAVFGTPLATNVAIKEISYLTPGECLQVEAGRITRTFYWHPRSFIRDEVIEDPEHAAASARRIGRACVHSWVNGHRAILHKLSGGLDSSIVLACLRDAPSRPRITCVNEYSNGSNEDEREYARLMADRAQCALVELPRNADISFKSLLHGVRTPLPTTYLLGLGLDQTTTEYSRRQDATAIFTGTLNDAVFYVSPVLPALSDFVAAHGWNRRALRLAYEVAILAQASVWRVLRDTLRSALRRSRRSRDLPQFLLSDPAEGGAVAANPGLVALLKRANRTVHPWFEDVQDLPLGKLWHIWQIATFPYDDPFARARDPEMIHPMMSQPLAELCLRIPVYVHLYQGWDRAIARRAFSTDLPEAIVRRTAKGGMEQYAREVITRNIQFAREVLLDGALVRERVVDKSKLEAALSQLPVRISARPSEIDRYLSTEIWLHQWTAGRHDASALLQASGFDAEASDRARPP